MRKIEIMVSIITSSSQNYEKIIEVLSTITVAELKDYICLVLHLSSNNFSFELIQNDILKNLNQQNFSTLEEAQIFQGSRVSLREEDTNISNNDLNVEERKFRDEQNSNVQFMEKERNDRKLWENKIFDATSSTKKKFKIQALKYTMSNLKLIHQAHVKDMMSQKLY